MSVQCRDQTSHRGDVGGSVSPFSSRPTPFSAERQVRPQGGSFPPGKLLLRAVVPPVLGPASVPNRLCLPLILPEAVPRQRVAPKTLTKPAASQWLASSWGFQVRSGVSCGLLCVALLSKARMEHSRSQHLLTRSILSLPGPPFIPL